MCFFFLDWQLQRRAPSVVLHLKVIGHSVCCVLPYFLKNIYYKLKITHVNQATQGQLPLFYMFRHQRVAPASFCPGVSLLKQKMEEIQDISTKQWQELQHSSFHYEMRDVQGTSIYRRGSSTDEALHIFSLFCFSSLFSL